jgi:RHH-type proline utilization regulon transcriptional repressor/proline dehydrogenase/delta 1-pyrroline-5-carboxylate dehydrogenase
VAREVFGPVLHVLRYRRADLDSLIDAINASGYGLTFGLHTRIDETIAHVTRRIKAGNVYVNRNIIGAVVGAQPFGGSGLSGTGPKAGGPLYLSRLGSVPYAQRISGLTGTAPDVARVYVSWLGEQGRITEAAKTDAYISLTALRADIAFPGPVGERNVYQLRPRGRVAAVATTESGLLEQLGAILATGNRAVVIAGSPAASALTNLPREIAAQIETKPDLDGIGRLQALLFEGDAESLIALNQLIASRDGPIVQIQAVTRPDERYDIYRLLKEVSISTNTAAAGGNASLMSIG